MANHHLLRHRHPHDMPHEDNHLVVREPQRTGRDASTAKASATSTPDTQANEPSFSTYLSVVFVTASPTFTGEVAGYVTLTPTAEASTPKETPSYIDPQPQRPDPSTGQYTPPASSDASAPQPTDQAPSISYSWEAATTYLPPATAATSEMAPDFSSAGPLSGVPTSIAVALSSTTLMSSYVPYSRTATRSLSTIEPSSTGTAAPASLSRGMSSGSKAGLAIGILLVIGLIAGAALWFLWKKKKENSQYEKTDDEKVGGFGGPIAAMAVKNQGSDQAGAGSEKAGSATPRLSLSPITQFRPDLGAGQKRLSHGDPVNTMNKPAGMAAAGAGRNLTRDNPNGSPWERRAEGGTSASDPFKDPMHPFADQTKAQPPPPNVTITPPPTAAGLGNGDAASATVAGFAGAAGAAGAAMAAGSTRKNGHLKNGPGNFDGPRAGVVPAAGAAGPPANVFRIQIDFKPSMEDELELRAGQLVRVLHEYDDGWALCVRLDRSQQGVAPRTCLSPRPVKPRPANGSPRLGPQGRPMTPTQGRSMSPAPGHPSSPGHGRSMSPAHGRPMTPQGPPKSPAGAPGPRPSSPASGNQASSRPGTTNGNRSMSPLGPNQPPMAPGSAQHMSPGQFNQAPRPLSPGPVVRNPNPQQPRSQSPGPYGANAGPTPMITNQRRRSNSTSAVQAKRNSPGSSPLASEEPMPGWRPLKPQHSGQPAPGPAPGLAL